MMTSEKKAYDAGIKAKRNNESEAACYNSTMQSLIINPKSAAGKDYVHRILQAWSNGYNA